MSIIRSFPVPAFAPWRRWRRSAAAVAGAQSPLSPALDPPSARKPAPSGDGISAELFYRLLLGDVALQRGENALAARAYLDAARDAQDPRIARRATEIALVARQRSLAQEAAKLWAVLDPTAERPKQVVAALAAGEGGRDAFDTGGDDELKQRLTKLLADSSVSGNGVGEAFLQINRLFAQQADKKAVYKLIRELAQPYPASPEAHFAVALAAYNTGLDDAEIAAAGMKEIDRALELRPGWDRGAVVKSELLGKQSSDGSDRLPARVPRGASGRAAGAPAHSRSATSSRRSTPKRAR